MKEILLPSIKANIGDWNYYISSLSFKDLTTYVTEDVTKIRKNKGLKTLLQRQITDNVDSIKEYILEQPERFFNAVILAVYDGSPEWFDASFKYRGETLESIGFLKLSGSEKIFPLDGQHRIAGIKKALSEKPELADEVVPVIFVGHIDDTSGMERSRRLFSTLNRYAKPVSDAEIIAIDEDDIVAIATRKLVENNNFFSEKNILFSKNKSVANTNKEHLTSIITFYQVNKLFLINFLQKEIGKKPTKKVLDNYIKRRPDKETLTSFTEQLDTFWKYAIKDIPSFRAYASKADSEEERALEFRNKDGGNMLFRPAGFLPFFESVFTIKNNTNKDFEYILRRITKLDLSLTSKPWVNVLWDPQSKRMTPSGTKELVRLLLIYLYNDKQIVLSEKELSKLFTSYADKTSQNIEEAKIELNKLIL